MKTTTLQRRVWVALLACVALAACGGSDSPAGPSGNAAPPGGATAADVPEAALGSAQAFIDYQRSLQSEDTVEPLRLQQQLPPLDDTAEPTPLGG